MTDLHGTVSPMSLANVMKTAISLSKLSTEETPIALELSLELKGEVNEHAVKMALREIQKRVAGLAVEDVEGGRVGRWCDESMETMGKIPVSLAG